MSEMIKRQMAEWLKMMAREYAVVSIMGPSQSGKTTLAKMLFPDYGYVNLEDPDLRRAAEADGADFMGNVDRKTVVYSGQPASAQGVEFVNYANIERTVFCEIL